jgi:hypothetical protein
LDAPAYSGRQRRLRRAQLQRQRHELLLHAVVQVALDPPPGRVGGGDNPRARGGELSAALGVRDGGRHQLRELRQALLGVGGQGLLGPRDGGQDSPQAAVDPDRHRDRRVPAHLAPR